MVGEVFACVCVCLSERERGAKRGDLKQSIAHYHRRTKQKVSSILMSSHEEAYLEDFLIDPARGGGIFAQFARPISVGSHR